MYIVENKCLKCFSLSEKIWEVAKAKGIAAQEKLAKQTQASPVEGGDASSASVSRDRFLFFLLTELNCLAII